MQIPHIMGKYLCYAIKYRKIESPLPIIIEGKEWFVWISIVTFQRIDDFIQVALWMFVLFQ